MASGMPVASSRSEPRQAISLRERHRAMKLDLLNRTITALALVALAIAFGVWLTRAPLAAAPAATPVKIAPEPTLAPLPVHVEPATTPTVIEVPVEVEIAAPADPPAAAPAAKPDKATSKPRPAYQPRRRGLFWRR